jgi:hypothetical protein
MLGIGLILVLAVIAGGLAIYALVKQPAPPSVPHVLLAVAVLLLAIAVGIEHYAGSGVHG